MISSKESSPASVPGTASETSRGSSVSSDLQREYEDILKYAIVTPRFDTAIPSIYQREDGDIGRREQHNLSTIAEVSSTEASASRPGTAEDTGEGRSSEGNSDTPKYRSPIEILSPLMKADQIESFAYNDLQKDESLSSRQSSPSTTLPDSLGERIDVDLVRMESLMDKWCLQLKRNVLGEFSNSKMRQLEIMKEELETRKKRHAAEEDALRNQIENQNELLHAFEKSIHQKDVVITNLTNTLQKQRDKQEKLKILLTWKLKNNDEKREKFASKLAEKHYKRSIVSKTWLGWRNVIEMRWKQRVERACQARSQEVCVKLTEDYEERLQALQKSLEIARAEIANLHSERDHYEETMKKAFMRGVCALNMEAMNMFKGKGSDETEIPLENESHRREIKTSERLNSKTSATNVGKSQSVSDPKSYNGNKPIHVKAFGRSSFGSKNVRNERLASSQPKIASVFVEKHNTNQKLQSHAERATQKAHDEAKKIQGYNEQTSMQSIKIVE